MRTLVVIAALVAVRDAEAACGEPGFEPHRLDRAQLADTVKPGPVAVSMWIEEAASGGCSTIDRPRCDRPSGRRLIVNVAASDDQTPPDKLGYRVTVTAGTAPFLAPGDIRPVDDLLVFDLGDGEDFDFELAFRAIDLNGNIGPATYTQVAQSASGEGCASHHARGAVSFGVLAAMLALLVGRRRRSS